MTNFRVNGDEEGRKTVVKLIKRRARKSLKDKYINGENEKSKQSLFI